jgi:uncharacterized protein (DUF983 family)
MDAAKRTMNLAANLAASNSTPVNSAPAVPRRDWWPAVKRGFLGRCPHCGTGRIFGRFLKVNEHCPHCNEVLHHHRADDLPPYLVILVVGHVVVAGILIVEQSYDWPVWLHMMVWPSLTVALSLALLQPVKGAVVGLQWALRMHGFAGGHDAEAILRPKERQHDDI